MIHLTHISLIASSYSTYSFTPHYPTFYTLRKIYQQSPLTNPAQCSKGFRSDAKFLITHSTLESLLPQPRNKVSEFHQRFLLFSKSWSSLLMLCFHNVYHNMLQHQSHQSTQLSTYSQAQPLP